MYQIQVTLPTHDVVRVHVGDRHSAISFAWWSRRQRFRVRYRKIPRAESISVNEARIIGGLIKIYVNEIKTGGWKRWASSV